MIVRRRINPLLFRQGDSGIWPGGYLSEVADTEEEQVSQGVLFGDKEFLLPVKPSGHTH